MCIRDSLAGVRSRSYEPARLGFHQAQAGASGGDRFVMKLVIIGGAGFRVPQVMAAVAASGPVDEVVLVLSLIHI